LIFSDTNTLLVENQIEKILIKKLKANLKKTIHKKSIKIERINDNEFINVDENKQKLQANELSKFTNFIMMHIDGKNSKYLKSIIFN
jgi:hypothetical protein